MTHWKNMPSPVSKRFTGTKFVPKKTTAIATATYPVASPAPRDEASCASHILCAPSLSVPPASAMGTGAVGGLALCGRFGAEEDTR